MGNKNKVYIKEASCISAQDTFDTETFVFEKLSDNCEKNGYVLAKNPDFKTYIPARKLRRLSVIIRRALVIAQEILKKVKNDTPDAIIVGTGLGCLHETVSFLDTMTQVGENLLNPSHFIQSTHNTIAGQIALMLNCNNYNMTFTQKKVSFETALIDALAMFEQEEIKNVLLGGIDEIDIRIIEEIKSLLCYKKNIIGEGAAFFFLDNNISEVELVGNELTFGKKIDIIQILKKHDIEKIDLIISGEYRAEEQYNDLKKHFSNAEYIQYKHFVGTYDTDSSMAMWLGYIILKEQKLPEGIKSDNTKKYKNCLIYNANYNSESLILLKHTQ